MASLTAQRLQRGLLEFLPCMLRVTGAIAWPSPGGQRTGAGPQVGAHYIGDIWDSGVCRQNILFYQEKQKVENKICDCRVIPAPLRANVKVLANREYFYWTEIAGFDRSFIV